MLQRALYAGMLLAVFILCTAMGGTGGFERAPRVEKNYAVVVTDAAGNKIEGEKFSWEGQDLLLRIPGHGAGDNAL